MFENKNKLLIKKYQVNLQDPCDYINNRRFPHSSSVLQIFQYLFEYTFSKDFFSFLEKFGNCLTKLTSMMLLEEKKGAKTISGSLTIREWVNRTTGICACAHTSTLVVQVVIYVICSPIDILLANGQFTAFISHNRAYNTSFLVVPVSLSLVHFRYIQTQVDASVYYSLSVHVHIRRLQPIFPFILPTVF